MSLIIVTLPGAPHVTLEEVEKDNNCNEKIENKVKGWVLNLDIKISFNFTYFI